MSWVLLFLYLLLASYFIFMAVAPPTHPGWQGFLKGFTEKIFGESFVSIDIPTLLEILGGLVLEMLPYGLILYAIRRGKSPWIYYIVLGLLLIGIALHFWDTYRPPALPLIIFGLLLSKSAREYFGILKKTA